MVQHSPIRIPYLQVFIHTFLLSQNIIPPSEYAIKTQAAVLNSCGQLPYLSLGGVDKA